MRREPLWAGAWRQRLALKCAAAAAKLAGRSEDEAALRDAWHLRQASDDPGPAGRIFHAWRLLASWRVEMNAEKMAEIVALLGLRCEPAFAGIPVEIDALSRAGRPAICGGGYCQSDRRPAAGCRSAGLVVCRLGAGAKPALATARAAVDGPGFYPGFFAPTGLAGHGGRGGNKAGRRRI